MGSVPRGGLHGAEETGANLINVLRIASRSRLRRALRWLAPAAPTLLLALSLLGSAALPPIVKAATRTWDGGGADTLWNNPLNWSADTAPVAGDTVIFDGTSTKNATINVPVTVAVVQVNAGYTGTITQNPGVSLTVTSTWTQSSGDFIGGTTAISVSGAFTVNGGGLFTSTSGTLTLSGAVTLGAGVFSHNTGSVVFSVGNVALNLGGGATFHNVQFLSGTKTIGAGDTMTALGTLTLTGGTVNTGTVAAQGPLNVALGFTGGGTATLLINGSADQTLTGFHTSAAGALPYVDIDKPSGALAIAGTLRTNRNWTFTAAPGGLTTTGSTLVFNGNLTVTGSHTLNNVEVRSGTVVLAAGTTLTVAGTTELFAGTLNQAGATGILAAQGPVNARIGFTGGGTATLLLNGTGDQVFDGDHTLVAGSLPNVEINKPSGGVTLTDTLRTGRNWTVTSVPGGLTASGSTLVFAGNLTITGSHTLNNVEIRGGTVVIAAGTTVMAGGSLNLFSGALNQSAATGILAAQGSVDAQVGYAGGGTATLLLNGTADQTFTGFHTVVAGSLPNVVIDKPSGALTIAGTLRTGRNWTYLAAPGGMTTTGSTLVFAGNLTITGSHTLNNVEIRSGTVVLAAGTTLTAAGTTELFAGTLNQAAATGVLAAHGDVHARIGFTGGGTATLLLNGTADQLFDGDHTLVAGSLPYVEINKPSGAVTLTDTLRTGRSWTVTSVPGGLTVTGSTLVFAGNLTITGSHTLNNVDLRSGVVAIAGGTTLTVAGATTLTDGDLNGGTLEAHGDLSQAATYDGETAVIRIAGTADQTFTGTATSTQGDLPAVVIDKPSGTLHLVGTIRTNTVGWTWLQGAVDPGTSSVVFNASAITGSHVLANVELQGGVTTITPGSTLTVVGATTLTDGDLNGGILEALGDIGIAGTFDGETGTLRIAGVGDQTLTGTATATTGDMANVVIDKPAGTLHLVGTIRLTTASWTWLAGAVDPGASVLVLDASTTVGGSHTLNDIVLRGGAHTVSAGMPTAAGTLTLDNGTIDGGTLGAAGNVDQLPTFDGGSGTLMLTGGTDQSVTGTATLAAGDLPNVLIAKSGGTAFLSGMLRLSGASWTHAGGTVDPGTSTTVFAGTSSIAAAGMSFADLTVNGGTTTLLEDLGVTGTLHVLAGTLDGGGHVATVGGDVTVDGSLASGTLSLTLNGGAPQSLGGAAASIGLDDLRTTNPTGVTTGTEVRVAGTLTLLGPLDFSGEALAIANPILGTLTDLTADAASSLEVFGTGSGIVIPGSLPDLANLTLDNPNGADLAGPMSIGQTLTLTDGILGARPWLVTVNPAASVVRTAGHVDGALAKTVPLGAGVTVAFEVGDATTYAPVSVTFPMVLWSSTLTAETTPGEHPNLASSVIDPSADVNRWWSVENAGVIFDSADVTLTWAASDVDAGADPTTFVVAKWDAGTWTLPATGTPTVTSVTALGLTSFSEFAVGALEEGDLPDTAGGPWDPGPDAGLVLNKASVVSGLLVVLLVAVAIVWLSARRGPRRAAPATPWRYRG